MKNNILLLLILITLPLLTFSQEIVTGLYSNPAINASLKNAQVKKDRNTMLTLPFVDDFSGNGVFPDDSLWADRYVFINSSIPKYPVTIGVATFDALNDTGALYQEASATGFAADSLTSNPIRLDSIFGTSPAALTIGDSVYFSFYYQPQGYGNAPETDDSLVLEFYSPATGEWNQVWSDTGCTLQQFYSKTNVWFKQVMIPVKDSASYFQKGFRFRFCNFASLANNNIPSWAGNTDQWNIDYVYLNRGRNKADSVYKDIAFVEPAPSVLKNYYSMPWSQFNVNPSAEMKDSIKMTITNLDSVTYNSSYKFDVQQLGGSWTYAYNGGSYNIDPYFYNGYQDYSPHSQPPVNFSFPSVTSDSASFLITHVIKEGIAGDNLRKNDTVTFEQNFYNYYAYDDGVPEAGYGLTPANSLLAYKFTLNHPDTLRAVRMFFNRTLNDASQQYFYLRIWNNSNGFPNNILYELKGIKPRYEDSLNKYCSYKISDTTLVLSGTFYIGWKQLTNDFLNIGLDRSSDQHTNTFYDVGSGWKNSAVAGALMIRPVFGKALPLYAGIEESEKPEGKIMVYPNPSDGGNINIMLPSEAEQYASTFTIHVYDMLGNEVWRSAYTGIIHVSGLQNGIYILSVTSGISKFSYFTRLSIVK